MRLDSIGYTVLSDKDLNEIISLVRRYMFDGWMPSGPIVRDKKHYLQAMIKSDQISLGA